MLYGRVMRNIHCRHKRVKQANSFINARLERKLRKLSENPLSASRVSGLMSHLQNPESRVLGPTYELGPRSRVSGPIFKVPGSRVPAPTQEVGSGSRVSGSANRPTSKYFIFIKSLTFASLELFVTNYEIFAPSNVIIHRNAFLFNFQKQPNKVFGKLIGRRPQLSPF